MNLHDIVAPVPPPVLDFRAPESFAAWRTNWMNTFAAAQPVYGDFRTRWNDMTHRYEYFPAAAPRTWQDPLIDAHYDPLLQLAERVMREIQQFRDSLLTRYPPTSDVMRRMAFTVSGQEFDALRYYLRSRGHYGGVTEGMPDGSMSVMGITVLRR